MKNYDVTDPMTSSVLCAVCEKSITGGRWFARISHGGITLALCCPLCTETFEKKPDAYVRRVLTYRTFARNEQDHTATNTDSGTHRNPTE